LARKRATGKDPWKAKLWYTIYAPQMFDKKEIGETVSDDPKKVLGRKIETNMKEITGDLKKSHIKLIFKVNEVTGENAYTEFLRQELSRSYLRSQIRRRNSKVDSIFNIKTKDGYNLRASTSAILTTRIQASQKRAIRQIINQELTSISTNNDFAQFLDEVTSGKMSSEIYKKARKIYPLKRVEVTKIKLVEKPSAKEAA
jgi:small subunit ribosomal protein S3Ae